MLVYIFSVLAACANAASSVVQRKANKDQPSADNLSWRLIVDLVHDPIWFLGILGIIAGFLLQAAALSTGALAVVEPILIVELPLTLVLAGVVFGQHLHGREWTATAAITLGLAGVLYFLSPTGGTGSGVPALTWIIGIAVNVAVVGMLVAVARRESTGDTLAAGLLGIATGTAFGLTAALIKAVTEALSRGGFVAIFTTWQTYAMVIAGVLAMFLLQSALNEGPLVAAQPGFTVADPIVSILWGLLAFGEGLRGGVNLALAALCAIALGWGVVRLSHSPVLTHSPATDAE